jgi:hypothetical protein
MTPTLPLWPCQLSIVRRYWARAQAGLSGIESKRGSVVRAPEACQQLGQPAPKL